MRSYSTRTSPLAAAAVGGRLPVYVHSLVYRAASTLRSSLTGGRLAVVVAVAPHLPPVPGDADQLEFAVVTVLVQAARSAPDGGTMNITARMRGLRVEIAVEDTGFSLPVENGTSASPSWRRSWTATAATSPSRSSAGWGHEWR